ncbi:acetyl-CoA carboxylase biotin carboxylase subunit [bacterium SCSIO 12643]|nr:acetyl-CoA carboxylase biotin carboxylase subunit [bacterium SCSIO 12643]
MKKILVANRGEIALRIMRTCKEMGISTVAIYSEVDADSLFVKFADEAVCVGPAPSSESYLRGDYIIEKALELGVDGIHPGYGFLSENGDFAQKVTDAGIKFIGPLPKSMAMMGDKLAAKAAVKNYNIPMVPGTDQAIEDPAEVIEIAKEIGFPILIKAAAGGGGKGMRIVNEEADLEEQIRMATNEAKSAFGDGSVFIEKYVESPRHIEIQVLADEHGNIVHLFERDCSIQRRHQKVIEEAPSAVLTPELRAEMGACACDVARACDYWGAGTVEFLYDNGKYYFLEMNTRLQVEHPVSELIAGLDLVEEQIKVARGEKLSFTQADLKIHGHSIEVRVYAEDPENNFLPDIGKLSTYRLPQGEGVRVDDSMEEGKQIPIYYDPMISKLIVWGENREEAIERMIKAIDEYQINGVETTLSFCRYAIDHEAFRTGEFDTHFVKKYFDPKNFRYIKPEEEELAALIGAHLTAERKGRLTVGAKYEVQSAWKLNRL